MTKYLISFSDTAMTFPDEDLPAVAAAAHAVLREIKAAGVYVFGGGLTGEDGTIVAGDGTVSAWLRHPGELRLGGMTIVDVRSRADAEHWAAKIAVACRCAQEVREYQDDPEA